MHLNPRSISDPLDCYGTTGGSYIYANTSWCLFISNELLDWFRARTDCLRRNGDLLTLQDEQKWEAVQPFITDNAGDLSRRFWIGLTRRSIEWVTGNTILRVMEGLFVHRRKVISKCDQLYINISFVLWG